MPESLCGVLMTALQIGPHEKCNGCEERQADTCTGTTSLAGGGTDAGAAVAKGPAPPALAMAASASATGTNFGVNLQHSSGV